MAAAGHADLSTLDGGFHGVHDRAGNLLQPGWRTMEYPQAERAEAGRSWESIEAEG